MGVVLIYLNEALSILKRAMRSIIDRTPKNLLKEIIMVDDNSSNGRLVHTDSGQTAPLVITALLVTHVHHSAFCSSQCILSNQQSQLLISILSLYKDMKQFPFKNQPIRNVQLENNVFFLFVFWDKEMKTDRSCLYLISV